MNTLRLKQVLLAALAGSSLLAFSAAAQTDTQPLGDDAPTPPRAGPLSAIHAHVCGFHFYSGDLKRALRVDHYCSHLNADVFQCIIYDSDQPNARLIGIEYIISAKLFNRLPADEKKLWHSHRYEVMSGLLTAPDATPAAGRALMQELVNTYGKTWHLWQVDRGDEVPLGLPKLMMGFTADGQIDPALVEARDRAQNTDTAQQKALRLDFDPQPIAPGADAWQHAPAFQLSDDLLGLVPVAPKR